jgi:glycosyltransferase involved in cell wall biosynthesis
MSSIVVGGSLAQRPGYGGHAWALLNYVLGLRQLGHEVLFLDRLTPEMATDAAGAPSAAARERCVAWLVDTMAGLGLEDAYALLLDDGSETVGLSRAAALARVRDSDLLLNVMGFVDDEEVMAASRRRVFVDIDPGFGQMWCELGLHDPFAGHDAFVTVGENVGQPDCKVPTCGLDWIVTPQPIALEHWPVAERGTRVTSVGSWRGPYDPIDYAGKRYGLRAHELRKLATLPGMVDADLELALDIDPADLADAELLEGNGWTLVEPATVAADPWAYRDYIQGSLAELMVAKSMYVDTRSGWFSDRSACYLASGRPVIAQDTGFSDRLPTGEGLIAYTDADGAAAGIDAVSADWDRHSRAAREIAEDRFEAGKVLGRLLDRLGAA